LKQKCEEDMMKFKTKEDQLRAFRIYLEDKKKLNEGEKAKFAKKDPSFFVKTDVSIVK
jgi:hypothetical protein